MIHILNIVWCMHETALLCTILYAMDCHIIKSIIIPIQWNNLHGGPQSHKPKTHSMHHLMQSTNVQMQVKLIVAIWWKLQRITNSIPGILWMSFLNGVVSPPFSMVMWFLNASFQFWLSTMASATLLKKSQWWCITITLFIITITRACSQYMYGWHTG